MEKTEGREGRKGTEVGLGSHCGGLAGAAEGAAGEALGVETAEGGDLLVHRGAAIGAVRVRGSWRIGWHLFRGELLAFAAEELVGESGGVGFAVIGLCQR